MDLPTLDTIVAYSTICFSTLGALLAAIWMSLIVWTFRDMRARSRDPFAQLLAALVVAVLPGAGLLVYIILRPPETLSEAYERALEEEALLQEIEERPSCPGCSRTVDPHWILCPHCHTRLRKACPDCNALMDLHWNLCPYCGSQHVDPYRADLTREAAIEQPALEAIPEYESEAAVQETPTVRTDGQPEPAEETVEITGREEDNWPAVDL